MSTRFKLLFALALALLLLASFAWTTQVAAQGPKPTPPGPEYGTAPRVSPADARKILAARTLPSSPRAAHTRVFGNRRDT